MINHAENILNVTLLEPRQKHPTIFARFDILEGGNNLTIHNDHDPKPLYYQLLGERGNTFTWEYLEEGPEWWKVRITKRKTGEDDETIGQLAAKDIRKAEVFKKYGLDFCCGGKKTVKEACAAKGIDVTVIEKELQEADKNLVSHSRPIPYNEWSLSFLTDYIINTHHTYVKRALPEIMGYANKVARVHVRNHPELMDVLEKVESINEDLSSHLIKEEQILFPYIKMLDQATIENFNPSAAGYGNIENPVRMMEMEHEIVGQLLEETRNITHNYSLPADACASYSLLYRMLDEFENDLHTHIHLENNILFPKATEIENKLKNKIK